MSLSSIYRPNEDLSSPNLNSVMAKLAVMNPQQLQAFAAANENDPIMLSAAQAVKNKHDEFMKQNMAMQGGNPPPVNQQVVQNMAPQPQAPQGMPPQGPQGGPPQGMPPQGPQGMPPQGPQGGPPPQGAPMPAGAAGGDVYDLPEDVGIGRLPTPNIARMAEGGITGYPDEEPVLRMAGGGMVAFAGGGDVPRYADNGLVRTPYGPAGSAPTGMYDIPGLATGQSFGEQEGDSGLQARIARIEANPRMSRADKEALISQVRKEFGLPATTTIPAPRPVGAPLVESAAPAATSPKVRPEGVVERAVADKTSEDAAAKAAADRAAAEAALRNKKAPAEPGLPGLAGYKKDLENAVYKNSPSKEMYMQEIADIDKPVREKMQAGIDKETERLKSDKEQDFFMSLIVGGAKAASGTSPYAFQNIADGVAAGAGNYKEALKDFRKATQENTKMEMELARYEATGKKDALKSYYSAQEKRDDRYAAGITTLSAQDMQNRGQMAAAGAKGQTERIIERIGNDPKFASAYDKYATTNTDARSNAALLAKYAGKDGEMSLKMMEASKDPTEVQRAKQIRALLQQQLLQPVDQPSSLNRK